MGDSRIVKIHKKIAELVAGDFSTGFSGVDFTSRGFRYVNLDNILIPSVGVKFIDCIEKNTNVTLGRFRATATFEIYAFLNGTNNAERTDLSLNACSDMVGELVSNRQLGLGNEVDDLLCDFTSIDGDVFGVDGVAVGYVRCKVFFQTETGA